MITRVAPTRRRARRGVCTCCWRRRVSRRLEGGRWRCTGMRVAWERSRMRVRVGRRARDTRGVHRRGVRRNALLRRAAPGSPSERERGATLDGWSGAEDDGAFGAFLLQNWDAVVRACRLEKNPSTSTLTREECESLDFLFEARRARGEKEHRRVRDGGCGGDRVRRASRMD